MALLGPIVVIADAPVGATVEALGEAGAFPIVATRWADAHAAIDKIEPCALVLAEPHPPPDPQAHLRWTGGTVVLPSSPATTAPATEPASLS